MDSGSAGRRYHTQKEILDVGIEFRKRNLPVDALVQDWQYWGKYGWNAMKFDETNYPDPKGMMEQFHAMDEHVPISVWSRFGEDSDIYKRMSAKSLLIPGTPWMDFFNPEGQKTFWAELKTGIFDYGLDGWWMDASEPEFDILKGHQTFLGSGESVRNAYPLYVTKAIYEGQRSTTDRKRVVIFTRSAYTGTTEKRGDLVVGRHLRELDYVSTADSGRPQLQHGRPALLDDGRWRILPAERPIYE